MSSSRYHLINQARIFINKASGLSGVTRIALLGSLLTAKPKPKDVDLLVTITDRVSA